MSYKQLHPSNITIYSNKNKPEPEYVRLRNTTSVEIPLRRTSSLFGFQEVLIPPGGEADVETGLFSQYWCQVQLRTGLLQIVEDTPADLPPAA